MILRKQIACMNAKRQQRSVSISIALCLIILLAPQIGVASVDEEIPVESWVNSAYSELVSGIGVAGPAVLMHTRPFTRRQVAKYLHALAPDSTEIEPGLQIVYRRLRYEFEADIDEFRAAERNHVLRVGVDPYLLTNHTEDRGGYNRAGGYVSASLGKTGQWLARSRIRFDTDATYDTRHRGVRWQESLTANMDDAYFKGLWGPWEFYWGRSFLKWGRSDHDGLLLSGQAPPFDYGKIIFRRSHFLFEYFITTLDDQRSRDGHVVNRYLAGHRLDFRPWPWIEIAGSEVVVFGGAERSLEWYYLNPFIPYYWEQLNEKKDDNPLWNVEISVFPYPGWEIYGEFLIDDFQIDFEDEPHQLGGLVRVAATAPFGFNRSYHTVEYSRVNTSVYGQNKDENRYYYRRNRTGQVIPLGSRYGPDVDRLTYTMTYRLNDWIDLGAAVERLRHGEWEIETPQPGAVPHGLPFPSGVVDRRWNYSLTVDGQYRNNVFVNVEAGWSQRRDEHHIPGWDGDLWFINVSLRGRVWRVFAWAW